MGAVEVKLAIVAVFAALGIYAPVPDVLGGMMVGLALCYAAFIVTPPNGRMTVWATLFVGLVIALVAAIAYPHLPMGLSKLPLQLVMGLAGGLSRYIVKGALNFGRAKAEEAGKLPGPGDGGAL